MAIEIVRRGKPKEEKEYQAGCRYCGTIIKFKRGDAKYQSDQREGDYLVVDCPICTRQITTSV